MNIYTKGGDRGTTNLIGSKNISKADERIHLVGTIDELNSHLGLVKSQLPHQKRSFLEEIQKTLMTLMAGVADPFNRSYHLLPEKVAALEEEIDHLEGLFDRPKEFVLPGKTSLSAQLDVARTVARRGERVLASVSQKFGADGEAKRYLNRLADYLYVLARYEDALSEENSSLRESRSLGERKKEGPGKPQSPLGPLEGDTHTMELVREVLSGMGLAGRITLSQAKLLMERVEEEALRRGQKCVIAVCTPEGNPIGVHVMDGAFLVSFDVATKKAYTAVAVKMSTLELGRLSQPGGTFYGLDKMDGGKMVIFGGGVPLKVGETIIGGLGISGGTGEEDHSLCEYALQILPQVLGRA